MGLSDRLILGYCTNVHAGESLADVQRMLGTEVLAVKQRFSPDAPFGVGLRLGHAAAAELAASPRRRAELRELCERLGYRIFTLNAFPFGDFAAEQVKAAVYDPGWLEPLRLEYTQAAALALAALPGPSERSMSTVAGGFRPRNEGPEVARRIADQLEKAARFLADLADRQGVSIRLCLEPEPWTTLETTAEAIDFFTDHLQGRGAHVRDHLGLCYDCCHQAVLYEDPVANLRQLADAGVAVGKIQVSSALHLPRPGDAEARAALQAFAEPRYLHQVVARRRSGPDLRTLDLPDLVNADADWRHAESWRCHFHVPIGWRGDALLGTTRSDWEVAVREAAAMRQCSHFEVETYTWSVLPPAERAALEGEGLAAGIAGELEVLRGVLGK